MIVSANLDRYSSALTKTDKTSIIYEVVDFIRSTSPDGGFVKKDIESGRYYEVGDFLAREKTSQAFRDATHDKYKSSRFMKSKKLLVEKTEYGSLNPYQEEANSLPSVTLMNHDQYYESLQHQNKRSMLNKVSDISSNRVTATDNACDTSSSSENFFQGSDAIEFDLINDIPLHESSDDDSILSQPEVLRSCFPTIFEEINTAPCEPCTVKSIASIEPEVQNDSIPFNNKQFNQNDERTFDLLLKFTENFPSNNCQINYEPNAIE